jgi:hypothetical protein
MDEHVSARSMSSYVVSQTSSNGSVQSQAMMRKSAIDDGNVNTSGVKVSSNSRQPLIRIEKDVNGEKQILYVPRDQLVRVVKTIRKAKKSTHSKGKKSTHSKGKKSKSTHSKGKKSTHSKAKKSPHSKGKKSKSPHRKMKKSTM